MRINIREPNTENYLIPGADNGRQIVSAASTGVVKDKKRKKRPLGPAVNIFYH
jgi:hypothetical protein